MSQDTENPQVEATREEVIAWYKEQIEFAALRAELAELQNRAAKADAERLQATMFMAQAQAAGQNPSQNEESAPSERPPLKRQK